MERKGKRREREGKVREGKGRVKQGELKFPEISRTECSKEADC